MVMLYWNGSPDFLADSKNDIMVNWINIIKTALKFLSALTKLQTDFFLTVGLRLHFSYWIYFRKFAIVNFYLFFWNICKSSPTLLRFYNIRSFSQGPEDHPFEMYISKDIELPSLSLCGLKNLTSKGSYYQTMMT